MRFLPACLVAALLFAGCESLPKDPFRAAEMHQMRGDLISALLAYDQVPVWHARYPEARAEATAVERRMRKSQELLLKGMLLRSEWRDAEAVATFEQAREVWPALPGVEELVAATKARIRLFERGELTGGQLNSSRPGSVLVTQPDNPEAETPDLAMRALAVEPEPLVAPSQQVVVATQPQVQDAPPATPLAEVQEKANPSPLPAPSPAPVTEAKQASSANTAAPVKNAGPNPPALVEGQEVVGPRLAIIEQRLARGELDTALLDLMQLYHQFPGDLRLRLRLARVLHQRALNRYGQGDAKAAIADWKRVLELDPEAEDAKRLIEEAEAEGRDGGHH